MSIKTEKRQLVTIISEGLLETRLLEDMHKLGVKAYSLTYLKGQSGSQIRASDWEGDNIRIETVVSNELSEKVLSHLSQHYLNRYSIVAFRSEVEVIRGDKFI